MVLRVANCLKSEAVIYLKTHIYDTLKIHISTKRFFANYQVHVAVAAWHYVCMYELVEQHKTSNHCQIPSVPCGHETRKGKEGSLYDNFSGAYDE